MTDDALVADFEALKHSSFGDIEGLAWPTLMIAVVSIAGFIACTVLPLMGLMPIWLAAPLNVVFIFSGYVPVHEAIHNNLNGNVKSLRWLNPLFGTICIFPLFHTFTMNAFIHRQHHSFTNDPELDPDVWVKVERPLMIFWRTLTLVIGYNIYAVRVTRGKKGAGEFLLRAWIEQLAPVAAALAFAFAGFGVEIVLVWVIPAIVAVMLLALVVDWAPHYKCRQGSAYDESNLMGAPRGILGRVLTFMTYYQNYHLIHHLFPRVPFYNYERIWRRGGHVLRAEGARIYDGFPQEHHAPDATAAHSPAA